MEQIKYKSSVTKAWKDALGGGIPGMAAMVVQVTSLMWLRTTMNYQYMYGTTMSEAMKTLYRQGGVSRFYTGYSMALLQGPLSRFGDTASNTGVMSLLNQNESTSSLPIAVKTACASSTAALFRILLMPIDTCKTIMQVEGNKGMTMLARKIRLHGPSVLFNGSIASASATLAGHYPWYTTYNYLTTVIPDYKERVVTSLIRSAFIGFCASVVSDTISNSFRVVKTARQSAKENVSYAFIIRDIIRKDGIQGILGRGLKTRLMTNCIQGVTFSVLWKLGQDYWAKKANADNTVKEK